MPHIATVQLSSASPYSQSRYHATPKLDKEGNQDYAKRTWREFSHYDKDGMVFIPAMAFKNSLCEAAKFLSEKIPGKGNSTYTKHFDAGVMVIEPLPVGIHKDDLKCEVLFLNADGKKGGGTRVEKTYPIIHEWAGTVIYHIFDDTITEDVFNRYIKRSGQFIGVGRWRPRQGGMNGRFTVDSVVWEEMA